MHQIVHRKQTHNYNCGPTALAMLLDFYQISHVPEELEALCETSTRTGTHHDNLVKAARSLGAHVVSKDDAKIADIEKALADGHPVLVNYFNPVTRVGHFAVIKGIEDGHVVLADPQNGDNFRLPIEEFEKLWHNMDKTLWRWMMHLI
jgi:ABC-type bacteriocin/lantibiotic exporter with double-glycine peptidase domain